MFNNLSASSDNFSTFETKSLVSEIIYLATFFSYNTVKILSFVLKELSERQYLKALGLPFSSKAKPSICNIPELYKASIKTLISALAFSSAFFIN